MKFLFIISLLFSLSFAENHAVVYKGLDIGVISNLNKQLKTQDYIVAKVYDTFIKYIIFSDYFVLYQNEKPDLKDTFFKKHEKMLVLLKTFSKNPEGITEFEDKKLITKCLENICTYDYYSKDILKSNGVVLFNNKKEIDIVYDEKNDVLISSTDFYISKKTL